MWLCIAVVRGLGEILGILLDFKGLEPGKC